MRHLLETGGGHICQECRRACVLLSPGGVVAGVS